MAARRRTHRITVEEDQRQAEAACSDERGEKSGQRIVRMNGTTLKDTNKNKNKHNKRTKVVLSRPSRAVCTDARAPIRPQPASTDTAAAIHPRVVVLLRDTAKPRLEHKEYKGCHHVYSHCARQRASRVRLRHAVTRKNTTRAYAQKAWSLLTRGRDTTTCTATRVAGSLQCK